MTFSPNNSDSRIWKLTNAFLEDALSEQEQLELKSLLKSDPDAREFFVDFLKLNGELSWFISAKQHNAKNLSVGSTSVSLEGQPSRSPILSFLGDFTSFITHNSTLSFVLLLGVIAALLLTATVLMNNRNSTSAPAEAIFVAQITAEKECQWSQNSDAPANMDKLSAGKQLDVKKGVFEITYFTGAKVLIEGPASYKLDSTNSGYLQQGKLFATVKSRQARQFTIQTPKAKFVDLGTEFGVEVDAQGRSTVVVFSGKVNASAKISEGNWSTPIPVISGEAVVCEGKKFTSLVAQRSDFPSIQPLPPPPPKSIIYQRWLKTSRKLQSHQDLIAYYDFQPDPKNISVLPNRAPTGAAFNGVIQKATWTHGRFPDKAALAYMEPDSGVRVNLPDEYRQMTVIAWVQSERLANSLNGIMMSDDWNQSKQLHLQVKNTGQIIMDVYGQSFKKLKGQVDHSSIKAIPADSLNAWCMITGVIDSPKLCTLYVNGEFFETLESTTIPPVRIGSALIGGWNRGTNQVPENQIRNFSGRIDELMIFKSVLTAEEIKQIYESGKPENH